MRLPLTFSRYVGWQFLQTVLYAALVMTAIGMLIDTVELIRRTGERSNVPIGIIIEMALLKMPFLMERIMPFAVLLGSLLALSRLTRSQELVVARAAGVSVWQFLSPALIVAVALGLFVMAVFNPLSAVLLLKSEKVENKYMSGKANLMSVSPSGLWVRQIEERQGDVGEHIIHALRISQADMTFSRVTVLGFDQKGRFRERLDADKAVLEPGALRMKGVIRSRPGQPMQHVEEYAMPTSLEMAQIQDSFASPETIPFWKLPSFIHVLEDAGFSALRHKLYWHRLLSSPLLYMGAVLIAAMFSLRLPRLGRVGLLMAGGIAIGFFMHFFTNIIQTLGIAGTLPVALSAWAPAAIIAMIGAGTLLHLEDG